MEGKYMLMKGPDGPFTVPLLAKSDRLEVAIGNRNVVLSSSAERLFVYHLFVGDGESKVIRYLQEEKKVPYSPGDFEDFMARFLQEHPKIAVEEYSLDSIPMQADNNIGLTLIIPYNECVISRKAEEELMELFIESKKRYQAPGRIVKWFKQYCQDYGYRFKKCKGQEYELLYAAFLEQHGISPFVIKELEEADAVAARIEREAKQAEIAASKPKYRWVGIILRATVLIGGYLLAMWLLWKGGEHEAFSMNLRGLCQFGWILMLIGVIWLLCPWFFAHGETTGGGLRFIIMFILYGFSHDDK